LLCSFGETNSEIAIVKDSVIHPHENIPKNPSGKIVTAISEKKNNIKGKA